MTRRAAGSAATSPASVSKLGYVGFETPDVDRLVAYYTDVLDFVVVERDHRRAYLTTSFDHHCVVIEQAGTVDQGGTVEGGGAGARSVVGFEVRGSLDRAEERLRAAGLGVARRSDVAPATPDVLVLTEPGTGTPLHLFEGQSLSGVQGYTPLRPTKLGHVAAFVPALAPVQDFYTDALGFRWADTIGDFFVFLRCNADHHAANFMASTKRRGMHHVAYEMRELAHLQVMLDHLAKHGFRLEWGPGRHGAGHNVFTYHRDPDGNLVHDEAKGYWEPRPWHEDFPQYPKTWAVDPVAVNSWGPINPALIDH